MANGNGDTQSQATGSGTLSSILTSMQQGVQAINNITQTMKTVFPSSTSTSS